MRRAFLVNRSLKYCWFVLKIWSYKVRKFEDSSRSLHCPMLWMRNQQLTFQPTWDVEIQWHFLPDLFFIWRYNLRVKIWIFHFLFTIFLIYAFEPTYGTINRRQRRFSNFLNIFLDFLFFISFFPVQCTDKKYRRRETSLECCFVRPFSILAYANFLIFCHTEDIASHRMKIYFLVISVSERWRSRSESHNLGAENTLCSSSNTPF